MKKVEIGNATLYHGDNREILSAIPLVDAVVCDPPYGINMDGGNVGYKGYNNFEKLSWDKETPSAESLQAILRKASKHIIWGGNYFDLPPTRCFLVWDKGAGFAGRTYAECEYAWTSLDANARIIHHDPLAMGDYKGKFHPTQKPTTVMKWCLSFLPSEEVIFDPYMGSGSTGVAAIAMGKKFIGIEREEQFFNTACKRLSEAVAQGEGLFSL